MDSGNSQETGMNSSEKMEKMLSKASRKLRLNALARREVEAAMRKKYKNNPYQSALWDVGTKMISTKYRGRRETTQIRKKREAFEQDLQAYMEQVGLKQKKRYVNLKQVDTFLLFRAVLQNGGYNQVIKRGTLPAIFESLHFNMHQVELYTLKCIYEQELLIYETVFVHENLVRTTPEACIVINLDQ